MRKYLYLKCQIINCIYLNTYNVGCYHAVKTGRTTSCSKWSQVDPFRLFIAIEREKRNGV
jgi:hypothetical protein